VDKSWQEKEGHQLLLAVMFLCGQGAARGPAQELWARNASGSTAAATCRPSTMAPTQSCSCRAASATSGSRWATGRTTSPGFKPLHQRLLRPQAVPPRHGQPRRDPQPKRIRFNLTLPAVADPGTVFLGTPARFFARPGEASSSRYPQRNRGPPAWQHLLQR
jgi:hypothetical protein